MPLAGIEAIFSSTDLEVAIEDEVYTFLLEWAHEQYPKLKERNNIWSSHLLPLVRFCHMSYDTLHQVLTCSDDGIDHEQTIKRITEVLRQKQGFPAADAEVPERAYRMKPVKVVHFDRPCQQAIVFLDLTREECSRLFPDMDILSHFFHLAGHGFYLMAKCECDEESKSYSFGLWLVNNLKPANGKPLTLDFEFAARERSSVEFVRMFKEQVIYNSNSGARGCYDLFEVEWSKFIADDNLFIDGVLHLRADFKVVVGQQELQS